jgi:hypothetical protein
MRGPKTVSNSVLRYDSSGIPFFEKTEQYFEWDGYDYVESVEKRKVEKVSIDEKSGYFRKIETSIIIIRKAYDSEMLETVGYFRQVIRLEVPNERAFELTYFKKTKNGHICVVQFQEIGSVAQPLAVNDPDYVHKEGRAVQIEMKEARELLVSHQAIGLYDEIRGAEGKLEYRLNV